VKRRQFEVKRWELAAAYPAPVPLVDGTADPQIQWQQLRHLAAMQLSRVHTISDANAAAARHPAAIQALAKPDLGHTNVFCCAPTCTTRDTTHHFAIAK